MQLKPSIGASGYVTEAKAFHSAIHRIIEQRAAQVAERPAIVDGPQCITYKDLNLRANMLARRLAESGLRRGSLALVRMPRGIDLATTLLAVLKAGASYAWIEPGSSADIEMPCSVSILRSRSSREEAYVALNVEGALAECASRTTSNLPVLTRGSDVACVLLSEQGKPHILVPHETIAALPQTSAHEVMWHNAAGALDLWLALMSGATMSVMTPVPKSAAA